MQGPVWWREMIENASFKNVCDVLLCYTGGAEDRQPASVHPHRGRDQQPRGRPQPQAGEADSLQGTNPVTLNLFHLNRLQKTFAKKSTIGWAIFGKEVCCRGK